MKLFSFLNRFRKHGRPRENMDVQHGRPGTKRDYHKKARVTIRMDAHVKASAQVWAREHETTLSGMVETFLSALMFSRSASKMKKLLIDARN